jgi:hypothetical protein
VTSLYACQECGRKFRTARAAGKASRDGCPGCGGVDIDLDVPARRPGPDVPPYSEADNPSNGWESPEAPREGGAA